MERTILIAGGCGFIGSNLAVKLKTIYGKYTIIAFDNLSRRGSELNIPRLQNLGIDFFHGDIRNIEDLNIPCGIDVIIDAAANPSVLSGINSPVAQLINNNLIGTINLLDLANKKNASFIFLSSSRVYPIDELENCSVNETATRFVYGKTQLIKGVGEKGINEDFSLTGNRSFYGASKLACELFIQEYHTLKGMKTVINRCGLVSGPWQMGKIDQGIISFWLLKHFYKQSLNYIGYNGSGKQVRDALHIDDLFDLIEYQINNIDKINGQTFNIGGGTDISFSLLELSTLCEKITGNKISIGKINKNRAADIRIYISDCSKIYSVTGWKPNRSISQIVTDTYNWIINNEHDLKHILK